MGNAVDPTGLSFTVTKIDGTTASVSPQTLTPTTWGDTVGTQTCTFTYSDGYDSVSCDVEANVLAVSVVLTSLNVTGTPATQYVGNVPNLTGLTFTAVYSDESEETVDSSDISVSPATWSTTGSATLTCSYTEDEVTVSANVSVTVEELVITSLEVTGKPTAPQENGFHATFTGMTFTFGLSNGLSLVKSGAEIDADLETVGDHYITFASDGYDSHYNEWDVSGSSAKCTFTVGNKWTSEGYEIDSPAPSDDVTIYMHVPASIAITSVVSSMPMIKTNHPAGEFDEWASIGDGDYVTVEVTYADGDVETADSQDLDFPVEPDFASGNPNNLGNYNFTVRYNNDNSLTANGTIKGSRPDGQTMDVRATDAGLSDYRPGCNGLIYHDFPEATWNAIKADGTGLKGMAAIYDPSIPQVQEGEWVCVSIRKDHYDNDTPVDYTTFGGYLSDYGVVTQSSGTPNTSGYKPGWGSLFDGNDLSACSISLQIDGTGTDTSNFNTVYTIIGKAKKTFNAPDSVKKSDIDTTVTGALIYSDKIGPVDFS